MLPPGAIANQFQAFEDRPKNWDAWDVDIFYDDKIWLAEPASSIRVVEAGPLRATLEIKRRILNSAYVQRISLRAQQPAPGLRHDHRTGSERHILLKVAFPVDVLAPQATYEIQWGNVQRPTHRNTSWDWARFETCAQKWVDLSEGGYGVSLLNDCKYGHDIRDNVMRLSLLRTPTMPDPEADQGEQQLCLQPPAARRRLGRDAPSPPPTPSTTRCSCGSTVRTARRHIRLAGAVPQPATCPTSSSRRSSRPKTGAASSCACTRPSASAAR